jgi:hypothetical protein
MFKKTALALVIGSTLLASGIVSAYPMNPTENNVAQYFSVDMQDKYYLYADSQDAKLIWFVPKMGFIASKGRGNRIAPNFNGSETTPSFGTWPAIRPGESQVRLGGSFNTTGDIESLKILKREARAKGYNIAPAMVNRAKSTFIVEGTDIDGDGNIDVNCTQKPYNVNGYKSTIHICSVTAADGTKKEVSTLERATFKVPEGRTSVSTRIPFQILSLPDSNISADISNTLMDGGSLDHYYQFVISWNLNTASSTRVARITVDWNQTFEQASKFLAVRGFLCNRIEIRKFFKKLVQEGKGVVVEYRHADGSYHPEATDDAQFIKVVEGVRKELRDELFQQVREYSQSQLGTVSTNVRSFFTLRANYEKQIFKRHETRYVNWNPGMKMESPQTNMGIDCVQGGFGLPVKWSNSPECQAVVGTIIQTNNWNEIGG